MQRSVQRGAVLVSSEAGGAGADVSARLGVTPATFRVTVTRRSKYVLKDRDEVIQAVAPAQIIESALPTLAPGTGARKTVWLRACARDDRTFGGSGPPLWLVA